MQIFKNPNYNFVGYRWHALALSWALILAGLLTIYFKGLPLGVEFSGGTIVVLEFDQVPGLDRIRDAVGPGFGGGENIVVQNYGAASERRVMVRVPETGREAGAELTKPAEQVEKSVK